MVTIKIQYSVLKVLWFAIIFSKRENALRRLRVVRLCSGPWRGRGGTAEAAGFIWAGAVFVFFLDGVVPCFFHVGKITDFVVNANIHWATNPPTLTTGGEWGGTKVVVKKLVRKRRPTFSPTFLKIFPQFSRFFSLFCTIYAIFMTKSFFALRAEKKPIFSPINLTKKTKYLCTKRLLSSFVKFSPFPL